MEQKVEIRLKPHVVLLSEYTKEFQAEFIPDDEDVEILKKMILKYMVD